mgnify:CR=1 FL=1
MLGLCKLSLLLLLCFAFHPVEAKKRNSSAVRCLLRKLRSFSDTDVKKWRESLSPEWGDFFDEQTVGLKSGIKENFVLYLRAKNEGAGHIKILERYLGFKFAETFEDSVIPPFEKIMFSLDEEIHYLEIQHQRKMTRLNTRIHASNMELENWAGRRNRPTRKR